MGNFRSSDSRERRGGFGGRSSGGRFGGRGGFGGRDRRPTEMHDAVCGKCGKDCQVPFRPTGDKPVLCSDCFRSEGGGNSRSHDRSSSSSGVSSEQLSQINAKLDRILKVLQELEIDTGDEESGDDSEDEIESETTVPAEEGLDEKEDFAEENLEAEEGPSEKIDDDLKVD